MEVLGNNLGDRIRALRKYLKLSQIEFANKIGSSQSAVTAWESGSRVPVSSAIGMICRVFGVSEKWLETGEGEMFIQPDEFSLDEFLKERDASQLEIAIVRAYFELDPDLRRLVLKQFKANLERDQESVDDLESEYEKSTRKNSGSASNTDSSVSSTIADA